MSAAAPVSVRPARLPEESPRLKEFILGLQIFEHALEFNRRTDDRVAEEFFPALMKRVVEQEGRVFVAEGAAGLVGWLVSVIEEAAPYVVAAERRQGYVAELFVVQAARGQGIGTKLLGAAEADFRARGVTTMMIGVVAANLAARRSYEHFGFSAYSHQLRKRL